MKQINKCALLAIFILGVARCTFVHAVENTKVYTFSSADLPEWKPHESTFSDSFFLVSAGYVFCKSAQVIYTKLKQNPKDFKAYKVLAAYAVLLSGIAGAVGLHLLTDCYRN